MADLLELLLSILLELLSAWWDWRDWRFFVPFLGAFAVASGVECLIANETTQLCLSALLVVAGLATGIVWQTRRR